LHAVSYISCDPDGLYRAGGFPGSPELLEHLRALGPAGERVAELYPPYAYQRPAERALLEGSEAFLAEMAEVLATTNRHGDRGPATGLALIPDAVLRDSVIYALRGAEARVVYETHRLQDRGTLSVVPPADLAPRARLPEPGPKLFLGSSGSFNYGHWIVDDLARQAAFRAVRARHPGETIGLVLASFNEVIDHVRRQSLDVLFRDDPLRAVHFAKPGENLAFDRLYYPTPASQHPVSKSPDALRDLAATLRRRTRRERLRLARERLLADLSRARFPRWRRRLFVSRGPGRSRTLLGEDALARDLEGLGFERIDTEFMPFARQVAQFAEAGIVVGPMGAAMTGTIACRPGTTVVHLAPEGWNDPFFWDLAAVLGHRFAALYGPVVGPLDAFRVEPGRLRTLLARAAAAPTTSPPPPAS
jgi:hypothetical protein